MNFPSGHASLTKVTEEAIRRFRKDEWFGLSMELI